MSCGRALFSYFCGVCQSPCATGLICRRIILSELIQFWEFVQITQDGQLSKSRILVIVRSRFRADSTMLGRESAMEI